MPNCLAIDATTETCSVALTIDNQTYSLESSEPRAHAKKILVFVDQLLQQKGVAIADLDFIACSVGPGSFTGLRIGFGIAQGLAFASKLPLLGVSSLDVLAEGVLAAAPCEDKDVLVSVLDARMDEIYWSSYSVVAGVPVAQVDPQLTSAADLVNYLLSTPFDVNNSSIKLTLAGNGIPLLNLDKGKLGFDHLQVFPNLYPHAEQTGKIALKQWQEGKVTQADEVEIAYLRNSVSWNKRRRIRS